MPMKNKEQIFHVGDLIIHEDDLTSKEIFENATLGFIVEAKHKSECPDLAYQLGAAHPKCDGYIYTVSWLFESEESFVNYPFRYSSQSLNGYKSVHIILKNLNGCLP